MIIEGFAKLSRQVAAEGCVLLKNVDKMLPITKADNVAVFGRVQIDSYRSGTGSGGSVNVPYKTNILGGLREKDIKLNEEVISVYESWIQENPFDNGGGGWAAEPWYQKEMPLTDEIIRRASEVSNKALVVIGRTAGEDKDNLDVEGSYRLTQEERSMMEQVTKYFHQVAVVLNVSNIIDMSWVEEDSYKDAIKGILYVWQGGMEVGNAVADVLVGDVTPSGKLTDTIAYSIEDYPSTANYGNQFRNDYQEDIYVGYRYFETFCPEKVQFEFGYGLSYTQFDVISMDGSIVEDDFKIKVKVKNRGTEFAGKEVVQVYIEAPQGKLGKPVRQLVAFNKTMLLVPGEEQVLEIIVPINRLASYDDSGKTGHPHSYVLEEGAYMFYVGTSVRALEAVKINDKDAYEVKENLVVERLQQALAPRVEFTRLKPGKRLVNGTYEITYEEVPKQSICLKQRIADNIPKLIEQTGNLGFTLRDVYEKKVAIETFIGQFTNEELVAIVRGEGMSSPLVTEGTASAFGGVTKSLRAYGLPIACTADGPSGIRMEGEGYATQLPIGTLLAATWDTALVEALYEMEGKELLVNQVDVLLGPGLNIRRSPLNGRNFEYYSEDPLVTGHIAASAIRGISKSGVHGTLKHFACNNQEKHRSDVDAVVSERCLREIYLKGFEIAVKEGDAKAIMTAYNPINGYWSASNYDLTTTILREEWGFTGIVMSDWWAKMNHVVDGGEAKSQNTSYMVKAQNDLYMVVTNYGAEVNANNDNTNTALETGELTVQELQQCAINICEFLMQTPAFFRDRQVVDRVKAIPRKVYQVPREKERSLEISTVIPAYEEERYVRIEETAPYEIVATISSPSNSLAQTSCNLVINEKIIANIQTQGTGGKSKEQKLVKVELETGIYKVRLEKVKAEIQVEKIVFIKA